MEEKKEQVVEVEYNKDLVEEYKNNYIMEEDGIGADPDAVPYGEQTTFNTDTIEELFDLDDCVVEEITQVDVEDFEKEDK